MASVTELKIHLVTDSKVVSEKVENGTTAEDVCIKLCRKLCIGTVARHLFALRYHGKHVFLMPASKFVGDKHQEFDLRIRYKVTDVPKLKKLDVQAYDYFFSQARLDVLENKIPDLIFDNYRKELVGLGITDMYRVMVEKDLPQETVEADYKKYIPKEVLRRHHFFVKKPIRESLNKIKKCCYDVWYVKGEYLKQLDRMVPEYLSEEYKVIMEDRGNDIPIIIKASQFAEEPGINYMIIGKNDKWHNVCPLEDIAFISIRNDTVELSRKNGIPIYLRFDKEVELFSFVSFVDGYYRLAVKWTFNLCKDVITPSIQKLYAMRCHGPVGGEYSYAKLEEKRNNAPGCFIIRESDSKYNIYYIDVCLKNSSKPKTFKLERLSSNNEFLFNDDLTKYSSIATLVAAYNNEDNPIYLKECLPPSESDKSPLLLCAREIVSADVVTEASSIVLNDPIFINSQNILVFKGKSCLRWNKDRPKVKQYKDRISINQYHNDFFPDDTARVARKFCRNPDGDRGGPWCFVDSSESKTVEKEYCDIPFCDDESCMVLTKDPPIYSHYTSFPKDSINLTFGIKLWDPDSYLNATANLVLSLYALPITPKQLDQLGIGVEIKITNKKSAVSGGTSDVEYEDTPGILKAHKYVYFSLTWWHNIITLSIEGAKKPILMADIKSKDTLMNHKMNQFFYYSATGNDILWSFPFCDIEDYCNVHTTTHETFQNFFPLRDTLNGQELNFNIRTHHSALILFTISPTQKYPHFKIAIQHTNNITRVTFKEHEKAPEEVIKEIFAEGIVTYWKFKEFTITIFGDEFELSTVKRGVSHAFVEFRHEEVRSMRWFSVASESTIAHWTFYCFPPLEASPPAAFLPECSINRNELYYNGTQAVTVSGRPCLPWAGQEILPKEVDGLFQDSSEKLRASNYCRDPKDEQKGAFCYVFNSDGDEVEVRKEFCGIRKCKSAECKMAGTGNDYIGRMSTTRSNRTCQHWLPPSQMKSIVEQRPENLSEPDLGTSPSDANISLLALVKRLQSLNQYFDDTSCPDKWLCLREVLSGKRKSKKSSEPKEIENSDKYLNETKHLPHEKEVAKIEEMGRDKIDNKVIDDGEETQTKPYEYPYVHEVNADYLNETLFADMDLSKIKNYCRNPTRDVAGTWCYTTDPKVKIDVCNVRDCDKEEECILVVIGGDEGNRRSYILPHWKEHGYHGGLRFSIKQWNPDLISSFSFDIFPLDYTSSESMRLVIGDDSNERVVLYYNKKKVQNRAFSHIISMGKWDSLWLQIRRGELMLGFEGVPNPFFEWKHENTSLAFDPMFINYFSHTYPIGVYFGCEDCHIENVTTKRMNTFYPIELWRKNEEVGRKTVDLKVRGTGTLIVPFYRQLNSHEFVSLRVGTSDGVIQLDRYVHRAGGPLVTEERKRFRISTGNWTDVSIRISGAKLRVFTNNDTELLRYEYFTDLLYYYFSVGVEDGWIAWSANCAPEDIDGPPRDGGWSPWSAWACTVTCGGGQGYRTRACSNPRPNVFGRACDGPATATGACNEFECGDVGPATLDRVRDALRANHTSLVVAEGDAATVANDRDVLARVSAESPDSYYEWTLNGLFIEPEIADKKYNENGVTMVYRCMWKHAKGKKMEVVMKTLKREHRDNFLKDMLEAAGQWSIVQSSSIVRLFGVTVSGYLSMILEYVKHGPLDEYLLQNKSKLKEVDLIEASSNLANALWHLDDIGIVHGKIRCKKLLVYNHDEREFKIKLTLPSLHTSYDKEEVHWIPIECYTNLEMARNSTSADVWAFSTTLWEIFSFGQKIKPMNLFQVQQVYTSGKRLPQPRDCPKDIYELMLSCWERDPHHRKKPQSIVRDVSRLMYQVYDSRRHHTYAQVTVPKRGISTSSLASASTVAMDELCKAETVFEVDPDLLVTPNMNLVRREWHSEDNMIGFDTISEDFSSIINNFTASTTITSSFTSMQSIVELDDYNLILQGRIGQGFYGEVYKGSLEQQWDSKTEPRQVAVKKLKKSAVSSSRQDFEREIQIMKALKHPNIVEILGVQNDDEMLLVMEFIQHGSLQCYVKIHKDQLTTRQLLNYSLDIAKGMDYLGQKHIVHRDLAARNILVVDENHVKISDFGLAQFMDSDYYVLKTNRELPVKWYAPESLEEGKFSTRSDVWSYGVTLWEMFSYGEEPKLAEEAKGEEPEQQHILRQLAAGIRYPYLPQFPRSTYVRVIHPCWAFNPHDRPTFAALCTSIESELQNETD